MITRIFTQSCLIVTLVTQVITSGLVSHSVLSAVQTHAYQCKQTQSCLHISYLQPVLCNCSARGRSEARKLSY